MLVTGTLFGGTYVGLYFLVAGITTDNILPAANCVNVKNFVMQEVQFLIILNCATIYLDRTRLILTNCL